jgi:hypothetical protein
MYQKGNDGNNGSGLACYSQASLSVVRGPTTVLPHNFRNQGHQPGSMVWFYAVSTCLPGVPKTLVSAVTDSLPSPIEVTTLAHGAISFGSEIHVQWDPGCAMCIRWNWPRFVSTDIRVELVGRCAVVSGWTW